MSSRGQRASRCDRRPHEARLYSHETLCGEHTQTASAGLSQAQVGTPDRSATGLQELKDSEVDWVNWHASSQTVCGLVVRALLAICG